MPDVTKLYDFDYGTRFDGSFKETLMKGLGFLPYKPGWKVDGIPSIINIFIPKTGLRSWWMSLTILLVLSIPIIRKKEHMNMKHFSLLFVILTIVFGAFIIAGTGFPRYWIPVYPLIFLFLVYSLIHLKQGMKIEVFKIVSYILVIIHISNNIRLLLNEIN